MGRKNAEANTRVSTRSEVFEVVCLREEVAHEHNTAIKCAINRLTTSVHACLREEVAHELVVVADHLAPQVHALLAAHHADEIAGDHAALRGMILRKHRFSCCTLKLAGVQADEVTGSNAALRQ